MRSLIVILLVAGLTGCATMSTYGSTAAEAAAADPASARVAADLAECNPYTPGPVARAVDGALLGATLAAVGDINGTWRGAMVATGATSGYIAGSRPTYTDAGGCMARKGYTVTQG